MRLLLLLAALWLLGGCTGRAPAGPPAIRYGEDVCSHCRMIVSEERFAAALVAGREVYFFDDVGDLFEYRREHPGLEGTLWVHDYDTGAWLDARLARYVHCRDLATPMGHGLVATAGQEAAGAVAGRHGGTVYDFSQAQILPTRQIMQGGTPR